MNYNELLFNQDKILSFYPELARILNKYEEITVAKENEKSDKKKRCEHNGLNKAIFINQIHYWIELNKKTNKNIINTVIQLAKIKSSKNFYFNQLLENNNIIVIYL